MAWVPVRSDPATIRWSIMVPSGEVRWRMSWRHCGNPSTPFVALGAMSRIAPAPRAVTAETWQLVAQIARAGEIGLCRH